MQKLRLREVRQPTQSEELDKTASEPSSSLTSKPVAFLAILSLFALLYFVAFSVSFLYASSLPPLSLKLLSFHPHLFIFSREPDLEQMTFLLLFAFLMFHAFSSPHPSIKWEVCYQQLRWVRWGLCYQRGGEHGVIPRWNRFIREEKRWLTSCKEDLWGIKKIF